MSPWTNLAFCLLAYALGVCVRDKDDARDSAMLCAVLAFIILTVRITISYCSL